jgi:hypothetical protein
MGIPKAMHLLKISQPPSNPLWDGFLMGLRFWARFCTKLLFWRIPPPFHPEWESSTLLDKTSSLRKIIVSLTETLPDILLLKTLSNYRFERAILMLFAGITHLCNLEQEWMNPSQFLKRYPDSRVAIDHFQWLLLGRYLLEVYFAPRYLDSPCASHALLAIK